MIVEIKFEGCSCLVVFFWFFIKFICYFFIVKCCEYEDCVYKFVGEKSICVYK